MNTDEFNRLVAKARDPVRIFSIQSNIRHGVYAGKLPNNMQGLVGRTSDERIILLSFTENGVLHDIDRCLLPQFKQPLENPWDDVNDTEFLQFLKDTFSFKSGLISVQRFSVCDEHFGFWVGPLPYFYEDFVSNPTEFSRDDRQEEREDIANFINRGAAVIDWANEWYVLDRDGNSSK